MSNSVMSVVILAAGKGTRMYSDLPKVLHTLAGKPMVQHVIDAAKGLGARHIHLVYGHGGDRLKSTLADNELSWVLQAEQLGTGHAMQQAAPHFADDEDILMLYGDVPLITQKTLQRLREAKPQGGIGLLTVVLDNPTGYGRIVRENNVIVGIVEQKDATPEQLAIQEINTGILIANGGDRSAAGDADRRNQLGVGADKNVVADKGFRLIRAVIVTGDSTSADIHVGANLRIAQIGKMTCLGAFAEASFLHFNEVADVRLLRQLAAGT